MSLFSEYLKERFGWETFEVEDGFITFSTRLPDVFIEEFFVRPEKRGTRLAKNLADRVFEEAKRRGATKVWGMITPGTKGAEHALRTNMHYGFKVVSAQNGSIMMAKDIGGDNG